MAKILTMEDYTGSQVNDHRVAGVITRRSCRLLTKQWSHTAGKLLDDQRIQIFCLQENIVGLLN